MNTVETKLLEALEAAEAVDHETFVEGLDHREKIMLLQTARDLQKRGLLVRDLSERREGRRVLRYIRPTA